MTESALLDACRTLFGQEINLNRDFLFYLQPSGVKVAYRNQVKINHPDRFNNSPQHVRLRQTERFREIHEAYHLIKGFLDQRQHRNFIPRRPAGATTTAHRPPSKSATPPGAAPHQPRHPVPFIPLEFGIYVYYLGKISYRDLIEALLWQRRQRPAMGAIATRWGWLNEQQVRQIGEFRGQSPRFGSKAIELGLLSKLQVDALLRHQRSMQQRIGEHFVTKGLMTTAEADVLARDLQNHNRQVLAHSRRRHSARF